MPVVVRKVFIALLGLLLTTTAKAQPDVEQQLLKDLFDYLVNDRPQAPDNSIFLFVFVCKEGKLKQANLLEVKDTVSVTSLGTETFVKYEQLLNHIVGEKVGHCQDETLIVLPYTTKKVDVGVDKMVILYPEYVLENFTRMLTFLSKKSSRLIVLDFRRITFYPDEY